MRVLIVIPTYNEAENIAEISAQALTALPDAELLVVDDNSPDGTAGLVKELQGLNPRIHLLVRPGKSGLGPAYLAGFAWALERGYERIIQMDADGSHPCEVLPTMVDASTSADLVIGSRYVAGGAVRDWPTRRVQLSRWGNRYVRLMLGLPVNDSTAGFRVYRSSILNALNFDEIRANGYGFQIDMTRQANKLGARIIEVPITFKDRTRGTSKMSGRIIVEALRLTTIWGIQRRLQALRRSP